LEKFIRDDMSLEEVLGQHAERPRTFQNFIPLFDQERHHVDRIRTFLSAVLLSEFFQKELDKFNQEFFQIIEQTQKERESIIPGAALIADTLRIHAERPRTFRDDVAVTQRRISEQHKFLRTFIDIFDAFSTIAPQIFVRIFTELIALIDRFQKEEEHFFQENIRIVDIVGEHAERIRTFLSVVLVTDFFQKELEKFQIEPFQIIDLTQKERDAIIPNAALIADVLRSHAERPRTFRDDIVLADTLLVQVDRPRTFRDAIILIDRFTREMERFLRADIVLTERDIREQLKFFTTFIELFDAATAQRITGVIIVSRLAQETIVLSDERRSVLELHLRSDVPLFDTATATKIEGEIGKIIERLAQDSLLVTDFSQRETHKHFMEDMALVDSILTSALRLRILTDFIPLFDQRQLDTEKFAQNFIILEDTITRLQEKHFFDTVPLVDELLSAFLPAVQFALAGIKVPVLDFLGASPLIIDFLNESVGFIDFLGASAGFVKSEGV